MERQYSGSYQCGAVTFEGAVDVDRSITCNYSRCQRLGAVLAFAPRGRFSIKGGEDNLTEHRFNENVIQDLFFKTRGIQRFSYRNLPDGTPIASIEVNTLMGSIRNN